MRWEKSAETSFEIVLQWFRWSDEGIRLTGSIEIVSEYFRWSEEEIRLKQVLKLSDNIFLEFMKKSGYDEFWNCLTMFSLKRWGNSPGTSIKIVLGCFRWDDGEISLRKVLKLSDNIFVEAMREFGWDNYWDCLRIFSLKRWVNSAQTNFGSVWQYFPWIHEEIRLWRVLKLSYNVSVEAMKEFGRDKFWDRLGMFPLKWWRNYCKTSFKNVWQYFRWSDEKFRLRRVLKLSYNGFVEAMREFGWEKYWDCLRIFSLKRWGNSAETNFEIVWQLFCWSDEGIRLRQVLRLS